MKDLTIVVVAFALIIGCGVMASAMWNGLPNQVAPASQPIPMIQPGGIQPDVDQQNSETNLNNSGANVNNGEAAQSAAIQTQIIADSNYGPVAIYKEGVGTGTKAGIGLGVVGTVALSVLGLLFVAWLFSR